MTPRPFECSALGDARYGAAGDKLNQPRDIRAIRVSAALHGRPHADAVRVGEAAPLSPAARAGCARTSTSPPTRGCSPTATGTSAPPAHPTLLLLHGLEGSSHAHYMRGIADKAWAAGWNVVRLNQRNCGDTEHLSRGLYHSGPDARPAVRHARADRRRRHPRHRRRRLLARRQPDAEAGRRARRRGAAGAEGGLRRVADDGPGARASRRSSGGRTSPTSATSSAT